MPKPMKALTMFIGFVGLMNIDMLARPADHGEAGDVGQADVGGAAGTGTDQDVYRLCPLVLDGDAVQAGSVMPNRAGVCRPTPRSIRSSPFLVRTATPNMAPDSATLCARDAGR